jgi:hypothetical protein
MMGMVKASPQARVERRTDEAHVNTRMIVTILSSDGLQRLDCTSAGGCRARRPEAPQSR